MKTNIKTMNMEMTTSISDRIDQSFAFIEKILHEPDTDSAVMDVEIGKETNHHKQGDIFFAKMHLVREGDEFMVTEEREDLYKAIDATAEEVRRQVKNVQKKKKNLGRERGKMVKDFLRGLGRRRRG